MPRGELGQAVEGFRPQRRCVPRNVGLARVLDARHSPVQRVDQFLELSHEITRAHRHL